MDLAQATLELRQDHLPVARDLLPWEHHPCPFCGLLQSMNGHHLLQCCYIPDDLSRERDAIIDEYYPTLTLEGFAKGVVTGYGAHIRPDKKKPNQQSRDRHYSTESWRRSIVLGRKIAWAARAALRSMLVDSDTDSLASTPSFDQVLQELFQEEFLPMETVSQPYHTSSGVRLIGDVTEGGLSAMACNL